MHSKTWKISFLLTLALFGVVAALCFYKTRSRWLAANHERRFSNINQPQRSSHSDPKANSRIKGAALRQRAIQKKPPKAEESGLRAPFNVRAELIEKASRKSEAYDQPGEAAEFYRLKRLPEGETEIPVERYFAAREQMRLMPQYSSRLNRPLPSRAEMESTELEAAAWTPLGPGNIGGRTRALLINPINPQVMYAAGVAGGLWKTVNGGASWTPLSDMLPNLAVNSMAMDPKNPNVIFAGTGEGYFNSDAIRGAGIFKTTDGGATWLRLEGTTGADFYYVNDLVISPTNSQRIYAATRTGVWRSMDSGATWSKVFDPQLGAGCLDLAIRSDQPNDFLFASCGSFQQSAVYRNPDVAGSGTWAEVLKDIGMGRTSIAISPSNQNVIYAAAASIVAGAFQDGLHAIFRSTSSGDPGSWTPQTRNTNSTKLNNVLFSNPLAAFLSECGLAPSVFNNQGWYDNVIAVDPTDPNRIWLGGIDLFRSDDGGTNWGLASYWWAEKNNPHYAHADHHVITFHPQYNGSTNRQMFIGSDGGIFRTDDARAPVAAGSGAACNPNASGVAWTSLNNGYGVTQFYHGAVFPDGKTYFGGTQDNGTLIGSDQDGANNWREIFGGDGGYVAVNPNDPDQIYLETTRLSLRKSTDGGKTFSNATFGISEPANNFNFIAPFAIDPSDPKRLWIGGRSLWRSTNGAASWAQASQPLSNNPVITAIAVSPTNANILAIGSQLGYVYLHGPALISDTTFSSLTIQPGRSGYVSSVTFDPTDDRTIYVTYSTFGGKHVWRVTDFGNNWMPIDGSGSNALPDIPVHCLAIDPANAARIYVGTDLGVFVTTDGGANWAVENTGFANTQVEWLTVNTADGVNNLYAFTHGRGVWRMAIGANPCRLSLSSTGQTFNAGGGEGSIQVNSTAAECGWQASSNDSWITIGSRNGDTLNFTVAANQDFRLRVGTIAVAGRSFVVTQSGLVDNAPPKVTINLPTVNGVYRSRTAALELSGKAEDDVAVIGGLAITSDRGVDTRSNESFTPYYGFLNWRTNGSVPLQVGVNRFAVTVTDISGKTTTATVTVIYQPEFLIDTVAGSGNFGVPNLGDGGAATAAQLFEPYDVTFDLTGNLVIADSGNDRIRRVTSDGVINTIAGGGSLRADGTPALQLSLFKPRSVAVDRAGNLYIAHSSQGRVYRIDTAGIATRFAGSQNGFVGNEGDGGPANQARLYTPNGLAIDSAGNVFIADSLNHNVRKVSAGTGIITTVAGTGVAGFSGDGDAGASAQLNTPTDVAVDSSGNLYIADRENRRIRKVSTDGKISSYVAGVPGGPITAQVYPQGMVVDGSNLYVVSGSFNGSVLRINLQANTIEAIAGGGANVSGPGNGLPATGINLVSPNGIAIDAKGIIHFAESSKYFVRRLVPFPIEDKLSPTVAISAPTSAPTYSVTNSLVNLAGIASDNGTLTHISWDNDRGGSGTAVGVAMWKIDNIALKPGINNITVTAWDINGNSATTKIAITFNVAAIASTFAGTRIPGFSRDEILSSASQLWSPETVAVDSPGNLYIADTGNHRIRKVARDGTITTFAGNGQLGSRGDGGQAVNAELNSPSGLAVDGSGNVYVADTNNHRVRRVAPSGVITTIAGTGLNGFSGDGGAATVAKLDTPVGLALDGAGNLFIADAGNHRIRKLNLNTGVISTAVGNGFGSGGDGDAASTAMLYFPTALVFDGAGNLYIADTGNHRIRKVTPSGIISTIAGTGMAGFNGDGGAAKNAQLNAPGGLTVDARGNLYFADQLNHRVRLITLDGSINTVAGTGQPGAGGEGGAASSAMLNAPAGVAIDAAGNLFIADTGNHRVVAIAAFRNVASVSAASFVGPVAASEQIVAAFGTELATQVEIASSTPLPTQLAGTSVKVRDSVGNERPAPLFFVSPGQVNYQIPAGTVAGPAIVTITGGSGVISTGGLSIATVAPGLFAANSNGQGVAAAVVLRIKPDGTQIYEPVAVFDPAQNRFVARPIDLGAESDQVFLLLFGTGLRYRSALNAVSADIGGVNAAISYVGPQGDFVGLDQINLSLSRSLIGRGELNVNLSVDGKIANTVTISLK